MAADVTVEVPLPSARCFEVRSQELSFWQADRVYFKDGKEPPEAQHLVSRIPRVHSLWDDITYSHFIVEVLKQRGPRTLGVQELIGGLWGSVQSMLPSCPACSL